MCGVSLNGNTSSEDIFALWLQTKFHLLNKKIKLPNGNLRTYKSLKVPCCIPCNTGPMSTLENEIRSSAKMGYETFVKLPEERIFQWLLKIYYLLLYESLSYSHQPFFDPVEFQKLKALNICLQSIRKPTKFGYIKPWSLFLYKTQIKPEFDSFDYSDDFLGCSVAIRMNDIGIILCLQDCGSQKQMGGSYLSKFQNISLHPMQFRELIAKIFYYSKLFNRTPKYIIAEQNGITEIHMMPSGGLSTKPLYDDFILEDYAKELALKLDLPMSKIHPQPDQIFSLLEDDTGSVILM